MSNTETILSIEWLVACAGVDQRAPHMPGLGVAAALGALRRVVPKFAEDRVLYPDIEAALLAYRQGAPRAAVDAAVGILE
jgi:histidine ammonia-lyase